MYLVLAYDITMDEKGKKIQPKVLKPVKNQTGCKVCGKYFALQSNQSGMPRSAPYLPLLFWLLLLRQIGNIRLSAIL